MQWAEQSCSDSNWNAFCVGGLSTGRLGECSALKGESETVHRLYLSTLPYFTGFSFMLAFFSAESSHVFYEQADLCSDVFMFFLLGWLTLVLDIK